MRQELQLQLEQRYPALFKGTQLPVTENLMSFGCECDDGWYKLIDTLCENLTNNQHAERGLHFTQIKEKFGALRVYYSGPFHATKADHDEVELFVEQAERASSETCESCGKPASMCIRGSWYKTLCPECMTANQYKKVEEKE